MFVSVRCTKEKSLNIESDSALVSDSITVTALVEEEGDSLKPRKYIYLTIDDAPLNGSQYVDSVILIEKVKTNLFLVGNPINGSKRFLKYYETFRENPYIEIYNHSYSHANNKYTGFYKNPESVLADFKKNQSEFNISHKIARLPGRNLWMIGERKKNCRQTGTTSAELLAKNGYEIYGWDVEWKYNPKDYTPKQSVDELIEEIEDVCNSSMAFTSNHVVLLIHNQMFGKVNDKNNLQELIEKLKESDFTFEYLSSYAVQNK
jgi:peptidoglycan/xylan/chitin deacetylase (PgdA/CDA1 family)